ncbi:MAG: hypothetical protein RLZZ450_1153 [Pseudomonadota bacterium]|jgi:hypothetical protein
MLLEDQCVGVLSCTPDTTCHRGACVGAEVDPAQFAPSSEQAPTSSTLPATTEGPVDAAASAAPDAAQSVASDAGLASDAGVGRPTASDGGTDARSPRAADTGTATLADTGTASIADASARRDADVPASVPDAAAPPPDAGAPPTPSGALCKPGYYVGTFMGDYSYTLFNMKTDTKIQPVSLTNSPVLSLVLVADADVVGGPSKLRVSAGCMSGTMMAPPSDRPFVARMAGTLDCTTGSLTGRLAGLYFLLNNTDLDFPFTGALSAQFDPSVGTLSNGAWDGVEAKDPNNISSGGGKGSWTASFVSDIAPSVSKDPCVDVVAAP